MPLETVHKPVVRQNQVARTMLTFNNLEGTISRHVRFLLGWFRLIWLFTRGVVRKYSVGPLNLLKMRDSQAPPPMGEIPPSRHDLTR
jgi:hypothetical protein